MVDLDTKSCSDCGCGELELCPPCQQSLETFDEEAAKSFDTFVLHATIVLGCLMAIVVAMRLLR